MKPGLLGAMFNLLFPPVLTPDKDELRAILDSNKAASKLVSERAADLSRCLDNIAEATGGLFQ